MKTNIKEEISRKIGILLPSYDINQINFCLSYYANIFLTEQYATDLIIFVDKKVQRRLPCSCPIMNVAETMGFDGVMVATNLDTLDYMQKNCYTNPKYFYCWELDWLHSPHLFTYIKKVMNLENINYLVRSNTYAKLFEQTWGHKPQVVHDFNLFQLEKIIWS